MLDGMQYWNKYLTIHLAGVLTQIFTGAHAGDTRDAAFRRWVSRIEILAHRHRFNEDNDDTGLAQEEVESLPVAQLPLNSTRCSGSLHPSIKPALF